MKTNSKFRAYVIAVMAVNRLTRTAATSAKRVAVVARFQNIVQKALSVSRGSTKSPRRKFKTVVGSIVALNRMTKLGSRRALKNRFRAINTGQEYAMKVINKKFMSDKGRAYWISNEVKVMQKVSAGHPNIVSLHHVFEDEENVYLIMDLCTGGDLFARIIERGSFFEEDAARVIRNVLEALPENLLFRTPECTDIVITDFGLAKAITNDFKLRTYVGTRGYIAPEVQTMAGHGTSVDMWSVGVMTFFWLSGYSPFFKDEEYNSKRGKFKFEPVEIWKDISLTAQAFISKLIVVDPSKRMTAVEALGHPWIREFAPRLVDVRDGAVRRISTKDLSPHITATKRKFRSVVNTVVASNRLAALSSQNLYADAMDVDGNGGEGNDAMIF
ncbi:UNVERIFIED_CONTAM: hypothetical protein HDU68_011740 [Siphonaria sp. JEL0065]|nr:hypothetical protein HDU68_011740 [Siphonaria sp. JEL0065]